MIVFRSAMEIPADTRGFTLLEVIVAMAVLGIVLVTLFRLQSSTVNLAEAGFFKRTAPFLALRQIDALDQNRFDPEKLPLEFKGRYKGYSWSCEIKGGSLGADWEEILSRNQVKGLKKIQMTIFNPDRTRSFSLLTWRYTHGE